MHCVLHPKLFLVLLGQLLGRDLPGRSRGHELLLLLCLLLLHVLEEARLFVQEPNVAREQKQVQEPKDLEKKSFRISHAVANNLYSSNHT